MKLEDYITNEEIRLIHLLKNKTRMEQDEILGEEEKICINVKVVKQNLNSRL